MTRRRIGAVLGAALGGLVLTAKLGIPEPAAHAQAAGAEQQFAQLRQQVTALERRVLELEKLKGGVVSASPDKAPAARKDVPPPPPAASPANTTVTAPFTVVDAHGHPIMRITEGDGLSRGAYFYGGATAASGAYIGVLDDGAGRMYVAKPGGRPTAGMVEDTDGPTILCRRSTGDAVVMLKPHSMIVTGNSGQAIAILGSKGDSVKGYLELNDEAGNKMVEAGSLASHKGYVLASPYKASTALTGDPSVIRGGGR